MRYKLLAARHDEDSFIACSLLGSEQAIDPALIVRQGQRSLVVRSEPRSCTVWELPVLDNTTYTQLRTQLEHSIDEMSDLYIYAIRPYTVEFVENNYHADVFLQGDKRLKCQSSRCKSRNHFRCHHTRFVEAIVPQAAYDPLVDENEDYSDLIDE